MGHRGVNLFGHGLEQFDQPCVIQRGARGHRVAGMADHARAQLGGRVVIHGSRTSERAAQG